MSTRRGRRTGVQVAIQPRKDGQLAPPESAFLTANPRPKERKIRFSVGGPNDNDDKEVSSARVERLKQRLTRTSIDTADLSSVATAEPSPAKQPPEEEEEDHFPLTDDVDDDLNPPPPPKDSDSESDKEEQEDIGLLTQEAAPPVDPPTANNKSDSNDDDDDNAGGFDFGGGDDDSSLDNQTPNNETPNSVREKRRRSMEKLEKKKKAAAKKKTKSPNSTDHEPPKKKRKTKSKSNRFTTFSPKGFPLPRTFTSIPVSDLKDNTSDNEDGLRRSKRARTQPLQWWKGESVVWGANDFDQDVYDGVKNMPVPVGFKKAEPTPYKARKVPPRAPQSSSKKKGRSKKGSSKETPTEVFDDSKLRRKYNIIDGRNAHLWDEEDQVIRSMKVVQYFDEMDARDLPASKRKKGEGEIVGQAAQSFQISSSVNEILPSFIVGHLKLPSKGIKDAESVGVCAQVFTVVSGLPNSLELGFGDPEEEGVWNPQVAQRFLLSPGDQFMVPQGNTYRLQNHSKTTDAVFSWVIIRQNSDP